MAKGCINSINGKSLINDHRGSQTRCEALALNLDVTSPISLQFLKQQTGQNEILVTSLISSDVCCMNSIRNLDNKILASSLDGAPGIPAFLPATKNLQPQKKRHQLHSSLFWCQVFSSKGFIMIMTNPSQESRSISDDDTWR